MIPPVYPVGANARARLIEAGWLDAYCQPCVGGNRDSR
jgi:hypothetical protein